MRLRLAVGADLPPLPVPFSVVFHGEPLAGKAEVHPRDHPLPILDHVLRLRLEAGEHQVHSHSGLRSRLRSRVGQFDRAAGQDCVFSCEARLVRRTSTPQRRAICVSNGATISTGSVARANGIPCRVAAERPVITAAGGKARAMPSYSLSLLIPPPTPIWGHIGAKTAAIAPICPHIGEKPTRRGVVGRGRRCGRRLLTRRTR